MNTTKTSAKFGPTADISPEHPYLVAVSNSELGMVQTFRTATTEAIATTGSELVSYTYMSPDLKIPGVYADSPEDRAETLMNPIRLHIPRKDWELFETVNEAVQVHMSQNDHSHDYEHILRVCSIALKLYEVELTSNHSWAKTLDPTTLFLAAMVHDVGDAKYLKPGQDPETVVNDLLARCNVPRDMAASIRMIANGVSFSAEFENPTIVNDLIEKQKLPELAIVQDADRIDSLGVIGLARSFAYGGADPQRQKESINVALQLVWKRLVYYLSMMKTNAGRQMACERWPRMVVMWHWYAEETGLQDVLLGTDSL
jgi:uncharacterized protein